MKIFKNKKFIFGATTLAILCAIPTASYFTGNKIQKEIYVAEKQYGFKIKDYKKGIFDTNVIFNIEDIDSDFNLRLTHGPFTYKSEKNKFSFASGDLTVDNNKDPYVKGVMETFNLKKMNLDFLYNGGFEAYSDNQAFNFKFNNDEDFSLMLNGKSIDLKKLDEKLEDYNFDQIQVKANKNKKNLNIDVNKFIYSGVEDFDIKLDSFKSVTNKEKNGFSENTTLKVHFINKKEKEQPTQNIKTFKIKENSKAVFENLPKSEYKIIDLIDLIDNKNDSINFSYDFNLLVDTNKDDNAINFKLNKSKKEKTSLYNIEILLNLKNVEKIINEIPVNETKKELMLSILKESINKTDKLLDKEIRYFKPTNKEGIYKIDMQLEQVDETFTFFVINGFKIDVADILLKSFGNHIIY